MSAPQGGVRLLGNLIHPPGRAERFTIVLRAYLDASGKDTGEPIAVVAGFLGNEKTWEAFETQWNAFLAEFELKRFHATEFWARQSRPYNRWSEAKHLAAKGAICKIFYDVRPLGMARAIDVRAFEEWRLELDHYYPSDPYYFCLDRCLRQLILGVTEYPKDEGIAIYCDQEKEHELLGRDIARWHEGRLRKVPGVRSIGAMPDRHVSTHYVSSFDFKPLQAADILANSTFQQMKLYLKTGAFEYPGFLQFMHEHKLPIASMMLSDKEIIRIDARSRFSPED